MTPCSLLKEPFGLAIIKIMDNEILFHYHYMYLWIFVCGAGLVWLVVHLWRNAHFRKKKNEYKRVQYELKHILQHSQEILYKFDLTKRRFEYLSPACFSLLGYKPKEVEQMGLNGLLQCVHPDDRGRVLRVAGDLRYNSEEQEWRGVLECRFMHRDQQYRSLSDHFHVSYDLGEAHFLSGSVREVTQITRLEESLHLLEKRFHETQKMAGLGLLASGIAHDFNNLMTVVLGNTELALADKGGSDGGALDEIKKTTLRATELASQLLVYSGKTERSASSIALPAVVRDMAALLDITISKKVKIEYYFEEDVPSFQGDVSQIRQIAMNLITNASEAIGDCQGTITINIQAKQLRSGELENAYPLDRELDGRVVLLEVSDTGVGMDEYTLKQIFDPHFTTKLTGRGLGLASLLNAIKRHDGAVEVKSTPGQGTVFRVYFPVEMRKGDATVADKSLLRAEAWHGYGTALIADDEEAILTITSSMLKHLGFSVITAADGLDAVGLYTKHAEEITFLLMDINMPGISGSEAALQIRHINPSVPILFMSGYPRQDVMDRLGPQPHMDFIKKPFESKMLTTAIRSLMEDDLGEHAQGVE